MLRRSLFKLLSLFPFLEYLFQSKEETNPLICICAPDWSFTNQKYEYIRLNEWEHRMDARWGVGNWGT